MTDATKRFLTVFAIFALALSILIPVMHFVPLPAITKVVMCVVLLFLFLETLGDFIRMIADMSKKHKKLENCCKHK